MTSRWREHARPIVARVLSETRGKSEDEIREALFEAYPFGWRANHPYKVWLDEIARQRGTGKYAPKPVEPGDTSAPLFDRLEER